MRTWGWLAMVGLLSAASVGATAAPLRMTAPPPGVVEAERAMAAGHTTSVDLVRFYLARIARLDPRLHALIALNPHALADARRLDRERRAGRIRGPLHGAPILLKDNIESADPMPTTAGSLALKDNLTGRDATVTARLRAAGAVILGKTNLSEWANFRSDHSISGWSAVGGLVRNPYALDRSACGSSAGSAAAVAAGLASAAIGTETDGSITCPAAVNGVVGLKPTMGLVARTHIIPIAHSQDTAGPMTRSVEDAAVLLAVMAGSDPSDAQTADADAHRLDYAAALNKDALKGKRLGLIQPDYAVSPEVAALYSVAARKLEAAGAVVVPVKLATDPKRSAQEFQVLATEFKVDLNAYLASTDPKKVQVRRLEDLIAFNAKTPRETVLFGQETLQDAGMTKGVQDPSYLDARKASRKSAQEALNAALDGERLDALVGPTTGPAWPIDTVGGDRGSGGSLAGAPAVAGYPHITVPMGLIGARLPVGLSFIGRPWSDGQLLAFAYAFQEQGAHFQPPTLRATTGDVPQIRAALLPFRR